MWKPFMYLNWFLLKKKNQSDFQLTIVSFYSLSYPVLCSQNVFQSRQY